MRKLNITIHKLVWLSLFMVLAIIYSLLIFSHNTKVYGNNANNVYFKDLIIETNDSNLIIAEIIVEGNAGNNVNIKYHTEGATAIPNIDYTTVNKDVNITIGSDGITSYKVSISCLNDNTNREKLMLYENKDGNEIVYGRYFNLIIDEVTNATLDDAKSICRCYLSYNYKVSATTGIFSDNNEETAYIDDYEMIQTKYHKGEENIDGQETWKSWKHGVTFNNDISKRWTNAYINEGLASAYTTFLAEEINSTYIRSGSDIQILCGNKQFMDNYKRARYNNPGMYLYFVTTPEFHEPNKLNPEAMRYIGQKKNAYDYDSDFVHPFDITINSEMKNIYWIQNGNTWYASNRSRVNTTFYKIEPSNGILDTGVAIFNDNSEFDRQARQLYFFLKLVDDKTPEIIGEYVDASTYAYDTINNKEGKIRIYLRFNEPVYTTLSNTQAGSSLTVQVNNSSTKYDAKYVCGNYTDTLVFEFKPDNMNITSLKYELPTLDIADMAANLDAYKIRNNVLPREYTDQVREIDLINGDINLIKPVINVDLNKSNTYHNIYNLMLSINNNGALNLNTGTMYYSWTKSQDTPSSYDFMHVLTADEMGSFGITLAKNEEAGITNGDYYLHALAITDYGLKHQTSFGPYRLDGDAPTIRNKNLTVNNLQNKEYELVYNNKSNGVGIDNLKMIAKYYNTNGVLLSKSLDLVINGEIVPNLRYLVSKKETAYDVTYKYVSNIASDAEHRDTFISSLMGYNNKIDLEISFVVTDEAGNKATSNSIKATYDRRKNFETAIDIPLSTDFITGFNPITDITLPVNVYDISDIIETETNGIITISMVSQSDKDFYLGDGGIFCVEVNGNIIYAKESNPSVVEIDAKDIGAGYFEITPKIIGKSNTDQTEFDLVSNTTSFYLTNGMNEETINSKTIDNDLVLINKVFQLEDAAYYYLDKTNTTVMKQLYGATYNPDLDKYEGGSSIPAFSNAGEAKKYLQYMEYQDMYLIKISANIASLLNQGSGTTTYIKARGETVIAQEGQLWIRYKRNTWTPASNAYGWAFYYYGNGNETDGINIYGLSANLNDAINQVVKTIASTGEYVDLVTEETINQRTGAPYLAKAQIHVSKESATSSMLGSLYLVNPTYQGDKDIYDNYINIDGIDYALATNMQLSVDPTSIFYYKYANNNTWRKLDVKDGDILSNVLPNSTTGMYIIREYANTGIREYKLYIDKKAPTLIASVNGEDEYLNGEIIRFTGNSFIIKGILNENEYAEVDPYAYVAIYSYPSKKKLNVLYKADLTNDGLDGYQLDSGNYYIQVGDRSGNIITYTVLLSKAKLDVSVMENDSKTALIVKIINRDEDEIYSYEIYLNEVLITTEYAQQRILRDPGIYRINIIDIYGNKFEVVYEYDLQAPKLEWYYQMPTGEYYKYDENNINNMNVIRNEDATRTYNVYTSSLLRLKFSSNYNDDIKYEIIGLNSGDYSYSKQFNTLTFSALNSFKIRIWYENYPQNDYLYIVEVDNEAPDIIATFIGTAYYEYVEFDQDEKNVIKTSSFDAVDLSKYDVGMPISLDTLNFNTTGLAAVELKFNDGSIINGQRITLKISDTSDIKSYEVLRNGQLINVELNSDNEIKLKGYGKYVITVVDMLNNKKTFSFNNILSSVDGLANVMVDSNNIRRNIKTYGNDFISLSPNYTGKIKILITNGDNKATYIADFDGQYITYGQYYCIYAKDDEGNDTLNKTKEFRLNPDFNLNIKDASFKDNYWYPMIINEDYIIYVKYENGFATFKVENKTNLLNIELLYSVNNIVLPERYITELSNESPSIELLTGGEDITIPNNSNYIYISKDLTIKDVIDSNITKIEAGYSLNSDINEFELIYENNHFLSDFIGIEDGFYKIIVENKYGNKTIYNINKIDSLKFVIDVNYKDGIANQFLLNNGTIYSNDSILLSIYSDEIKFEINGNETAPIYSGGAAKLELSNNGEYVVKAIGLNGLNETFRFVIGTDLDFTFNENWISGYNNDAILKNQGYTNTKLSITRSDEIKYIEYYYNDTYYVLYDDISDEKILDNNLLINAIGNDGIGDYIMYFRNIYGDITSKIIHFSDVPALKLSRKTVAEQTIFNDYDLTFAIENNFYSNYILRFETTSNNYKFTIDGNLVSLDEPKTIEFSNASGDGSFGYHITYLDEYGNYVEFEAELYRNEVEFDTSKMNIITLNNELYTKDNIIITFAEELEATVRINGLNPVEYNSSFTYRKDGKYEFMIEDIAGNRTNFIINHKSVNKYALTDTKTEQKVINGGVINNSSVIFESLDGSTIKSVFKNGEKINEYNSNTFNQTGHWEILIGDSIGNVSYTEFYIINNSLASFEYDAPDDYIIREVWFTNNLGQRVLLLKNIEKINLNDNGDYAVVVESIESITSFNFLINIDDTLPEAKLSGVEDGGTTARNVHLTNLKNGDKVEIYRDGKLVSVTNVTTSERPPEIVQGGNYKIVVTNLAGAQIEYNFTRKQIANSATSIFIIIACLALIAGISIGLIYHTRLRTDS